METIFLGGLLYILIQLGGQKSCWTWYTKKGMLTNIQVIHSNKDNEGKLITLVLLGLPFATMGLFRETWFGRVLIVDISVVIDFE